MFSINFTFNIRTISSPDNSYDIYYKSDLKSMQIKLRVNLPVGDNFHDHPMCIMEYIVDKPPSVFVDPITKSNRSAKDYMEYLFYTQGL